MPGFISFAAEQRQLRPGWSTKSMEEIVSLCDPIWRGLSEDEKKRYGKKSGPPVANGTDSYGRSLEAVWAKNQAVENDSDLNRSIIRKAFVGKPDLRRTVFTVIHTNAMCQTFNGEFVPAEICFANFTLERGIIEIYHDFPDPGKIPRGYAWECKMIAERSHNIPLDLVFFNPNYHEILSNLSRFQFKQDKEQADLLFTINDKRTQTQAILDKLHRLSKRPDRFDGSVETEGYPCKVLDLTALLQTIHLAYSGNEQPPNLDRINSTEKEMFEKKLTNGTYLYNGISCHLHEDNPIWCSKALVIDWIYAFCKELCPIYGIDLIPTIHMPVTETEGLYEIHESCSASVSSRTSSECGSLSGRYDCSKGSINQDDINLDDSDLESSQSESDVKWQIKERMAKIRLKQRAKEAATKEITSGNIRRGDEAAAGDGAISDDKQGKEEKMDPAPSASQKDGSDDKAFDAATSQLNVSSSSCGSFNSAMSSNLNLSARSSISALSARSSKINLGANSSYSSLGDAMDQTVAGSGMSIREKLTAKLAKLSVAAGNDAQAASCRQDDLTKKSELVGEERGSSCSSSMAGARYEKLRQILRDHKRKQ